MRQLCEDPERGKDFLYRQLLSDNGIYHNILEYVKSDNELDLQIRENYINIYYKGGNILKLKPKSYDIDKMYFQYDANVTSKEIKSDETKLKLLEGKRNVLLKLLPQNPQEYFIKAKKVMDRWDCVMSERKQHNEKKEQQEIAIANRQNSDYIVLDLEYAVSRNSQFKYCNDDKDKKIPRFDIIAIHNGQLVIIELKKGLGSIGGDSGIGPHKKCFDATIGRDKQGFFVREMKTLLKQKKELEIIADDICISSDAKPKFVYAFADEDGNDDFDKFVGKCGGHEVLYIDSNHKIQQRL